MKIRTMAAAGLLALGVLALIAVIAANPFSSQASISDPPDTGPAQERFSADVAGPERVAQPDRLGDMQVSDADSARKPYIGITVVRTGDGPVEVGYVLEGGPSDGLLEAGDLITDVDGVKVTGISDLTDAIAAAGAVAA